MHHILDFCREKEVSACRTAPLRFPEKTKRDESCTQVGGAPSPRPVVFIIAAFHIVNVHDTRDVGGRFHGGKTVLLDALHWVVAAAVAAAVAVRVGFTAEELQSTAACPAAFVAVRALGGEGWH